MSRWDQIAELVEELEAFPPAEWAGILESRTSDLTIRDEVLSLLGVSAKWADCLDKPAYEWLPDYMASLIERKGPATPKLAAGEVLARRFRIESFLGRGGMAEVYAAVDTELKERVALKLLHADLALQSGFLNRFRREIRLARRIAHGNVARVFDLVVEPGHPAGVLHFYVMELIEGETLAARLQREGSIKEPESRAIARQLAAGLTAAHSAQVLHRDFKPSNVMLSGERAVITDFGLAAPIQGPDGKAETSSILLGTPGYLAPEQWTGRPASVTTDIYSFGIVLHEIVTGRHPLGQVDASLAPAWRKCIGGCLEIDPAKRWATPARAVQALEERPLLMRRTSLGILGSAAAMGALGYYFSSGRQWPGSRLANAAAIKTVFADVENGTGDPAFAGFSYLLRDQASQSEKIRPVPPDVIAAVRSRMKNESGPQTAVLLREIALRDGIPLVVFTRLDKLAGEYSLQARLELMGSTPEQPARVWRAQWAAASPDDVMRLAMLAGDWLRDKAGEDVEQIRLRSKAPHALTTKSWDALRVFREAEIAQYANDNKSDITLYKEALRLDPEFALAAYRVADLSVTRADYDQGLRYWQIAMDLTRQKGLTSYEIVRIRRSFYGDMHDYGNALQVAQVAAAQWPNDYLSHFYLASAYSRTGNFQASIGSFQTALRLDPKNETALCQLGYRYLLVKREAEAQQCVESLKRMGSVGWWKVLQGKLLFARGDSESSLKVFEELSAQEGARADKDGPLWRMQGDLYRVLVEADLGRLDRAAKIAAEGVLQAREHARSGEEVLFHYLHAGVLCRAGETGQVREIAEAMQAASRDGVTTARAAIVLAQSGWVAESSTVLRQLVPTPVIPRLEGWRRCASGELAVANRDREGARKDFEEVDRLQSRELPRWYFLRVELMSGDAAKVRERASALAAQRAYFIFQPDAAPPGMLRQIRMQLQPERT